MAPSSVMSGAGDLHEGSNEMIEQAGPLSATGPLGAQGPLGENGSHLKILGAGERERRMVLAGRDPPREAHRHRALGLDANTVVRQLVCVP